MAAEPVAETDVDDLGKTEPEDWYPFEICFDSLMNILSKNSPQHVTDTDKFVGEIKTS